MKGIPMDSIFEVVGPHHSLQLFGIRMVGVNAENGQKLLISIVFFIFIYALNYALKFLVRIAIQKKKKEKIFFWSRQAINLTSTIVLIIGIASVWFDDPARMTTVLGLITAGLAFALQKVVTALAGYFVILRGKTFNVGDRITMGGVRGDVISLDFTQTTLMEMGQPPAVQGADPAMWVKSRQYTGRVVTVSNSVVFDEPVYNYTRDFAYIWEEMTLPISYKDDYQEVEKILFEAAHKFTVDVTKLGAEAIHEMKRRYFLADNQLTPKVYYRLTDNWVELSVRFVTKDHGVRDIKDQMSREILLALKEKGIGVASSTYDIVGFPPIQIAGLNQLARELSKNSDRHFDANI